MFDRHSQNAISAAAISLFVFVACVACFLPPLNKYTLTTVPFIILIGIATGVSMILHFVFVGIAAQRLRRSVATWVALSVLFFPIGSIVGLILFEWFSDENREPPVTSR